MNLPVTAEDLQQENLDKIAGRFHQQHGNLYGYSLERENTVIELINLRLVCIRKTQKPAFRQEDYGGPDPSGAVKNQRNIFLPIENQAKEVDVYDGSCLKFGHKISGPAIVEQVNTTTLVTPDYNLMVDRYGSYTMYLKEIGEEVESRIIG